MTTRRCVTCFAPYPADSGWAGECSECRDRALRRRSTHTEAAFVLRCARWREDLDAVKRAHLEAIRLSLPVGPDEDFEF